MRYGNHVRKVFLGCALAYAVVCCYLCNKHIKQVCMQVDAHPREPASASSISNI